MSFNPENHISEAINVRGDKNVSQERSTGSRITNRVRLGILLPLLAAALIAGIFLFTGLPQGVTPVVKSGNAAGQTPAPTPAPITLSIVCVGDTMVHQPQIASQYDSKSKTYNYENNFQYVKKYISAADLALCNVETTFAGGKPTGYPSFNAPDALASALAKTGFDVAITSNNHLYDKGLAGVKRTLTVLRSAGLVTSGTHLSGEKNYAMKTVKGVSVAVVSYTYETPSSNGHRTINSSPLSTEAQPLINSFSYDSLDTDLAKVAATVKAARKAGAEVVVCYYHWGQEYQRVPDKWEEYIAKKTADMGADILFASHPHVLQKIGTAVGPMTGKQIPVFYSMGNFISNQRTETLNNRYTEQGIIARVDLNYDKSTKKATITTEAAMGLWVDKYKSGGKDVYAVIPLDKDLTSNQTLAASGHQKRAAQALADITGLLGAKYIWK